MASKYAALLKKLNTQDVDVEIVDGDEIVTKTIPAKLQERILKQVNEEYDFAFPHTQAKRKINLARLRLYNNQRKDNDAVGDTLMFTVFNTIHAALYEDRLMAAWKGRSGESDEDVEENLNALSAYDYELMEKAPIDYFWNWDAEFFGRGIISLEDFDRTEGRMCPILDYVDASSFIRDPNASSVHGLGLNGRGGMRFGGYEFGSTLYELKDHPGMFNIGALRKERSNDSLLQDLRDAHNNAMGREMYRDRGDMLSKGGNYEFSMLRWYTHIKGEKYIITLGNQRSVLCQLIKVKGNRWPLIDRPFYPMSNDWDGVSIPDLTEDKHRARAILTNLGLKSAKLEVLPRYAYDSTRIKNERDLDEKFNKYIPVNGNPSNAIVPVERYSAARQTFKEIMEMLDVSAQRAAATPEIQQGIMSGEKRTLGELELVSSKVDTRYSMTAKVFGWSEREFWNQWYGGHAGYKNNFKDGIDEKIIRIQGMLSPAFRPLQRDNIISLVDPDVEIVSKVISESKRINQLNQYAGIAQVLLQDPDNDRRMIEKKMAKLSGMPREEIDALFPPTMEELHAMDENDQLNADKMPTIDVRDNHLVHIRIHAKAESGAHSIAHIRQHKKLMVIPRNNPELFAQPQGMTPGAVPGAAPMTPPSVPGGMTRLPMKAGPQPTTA